MSRTEAVLGKSVFRAPIFAASGCFGNVIEMERFADIPNIAGITPKSVTREPRKGAPTPRVWEGFGTHCTAIALQNPGLDVYINEKLPKIKKLCRPDQLIISVAGGCVEDYVYSVERLLEAAGEDNFAAFEINGACPMVSKGGGSFSRSPEALAELVNAIRPLVKKNTLIIKVITMFEGFTDIIKTAQDCGADVIHTVNTCPATIIDVEKRRSMFPNPRVGVSGPAMLPFGVRKMWDVYEVAKVPVIASGGIYDLDGVLQYLMAGASAVEIGSAIFLDPLLPSKLLAELDKWLEEHDVAHYSDLIGAAHQE